MKLADHFKNMDPELAGNLEQAIDALRDEFKAKLDSTVEEKLEEAAAKAATLAPPPSAPSAPAASITLDSADEMRLAALEIDQAGSQAEILDTLSRGLLRFSSRVAVFVNRAGELHGWSSSGFGEADEKIREVALGGDVPFPLGVLDDAGSVPLSAADCGPICDALEAEHPEVGLMMPFVLGAQVVGAIYCDRQGSEPFSISALQLLTYMASQTLETLPVRKRESTSTLALAGGAGPSAAPAPASEPEPETVTAERPTADLDPPAEAPAPVAPPAAPDPVAPPTTPAEPAPPLAQPEPVVEPSAAGLSSPSLPPLPEIPTAPTPTPEPVTPADTPAEMPVEMPVETPAAASTPEPAAGGAEPSSVLSPLPPMDPPAETPGSTAVEPPVEFSSTQVRPPEDLEGPGWAFTSTGSGAEEASETDHEEAQRLARLLVTEIKLYNEEAVEEGRRDSNVYSRLQEDIDRSRQIFEDRIDESIRQDNDYFKQALVRILAGGDPALLGR